MSNMPADAPMLVPCPTCKHGCSWAAHTCPQCGHPLARIPDHVSIRSSMNKATSRVRSRSGYRATFVLAVVGCSSILVAFLILTGRIGISTLASPESAGGDGSASASRWSNSSPTKVPQKPSSKRDVRASIEPPPTQEGPKQIGFVLLAVLGIGCLWWIPCAVAHDRRHSNGTAIRMLNFLFGMSAFVFGMSSLLFGIGGQTIGLGMAFIWALLGWGVALVWALTNPSPRRS